MNFEFIAIPLQQRVPNESLRDWREFAERWTRLLVRHFKEQQKRELLNVVAIRKAVIPKDIAIIPELGNELCWITHLTFARSWRRRTVVCSRSSRLAATSSVSASQVSVSSFSSGNRPFSLKNTRQVARAVRLFPSTNGWFRHT